MPPRRLLRAFVLLWWTLGVALLLASVQTVRGAHNDHGANSHLALLAGAEALGAVLFLIPRTLRPGAALLLLTLGVAFGVHALRHEFRLDLLVYSAAVLFVAVHGSLSTPPVGGGRLPRRVKPGPLTACVARR
jgi:uncharacterized membrane protein YphA (DoxX/SURF4 family)